MRIRLPLLPALSLVIGCHSGPEPATGADAENQRARTDAELGEPLPPLEKTDLVEGSGRAAQKGDSVSVHYVGTLVDGTPFDSSLERGQPLQFQLGAGGVIPGWEIGVVGMKPGGKRRLVIPPHLGYGSGGSPPKIPPEATLVFEIELLEIL